MAGNRKSDLFGEAMLRMADARMRREIEPAGSEPVTTGDGETDTAKDAPAPADPSATTHAAPLSSFDAAA